MRQVASHVKDGKLQYFVADTEEGELLEFATIAVPEAWSAHQSIMLGFNLIAAIGLTSVAKPASAPARTFDAAAEVRQERGELPSAPATSRTWRGTPSAIEYVKAHPGCRIPDMVRHFRATSKAVASAVTRGATSGDIIRRNGDLFPAGGSSIMDTMTQRSGGPVTKSGKPRQRARAERQTWNVSVGDVTEYIAAHPGCGIPELAEALLGSVTPKHRQVISNRIMSVVARGVKGEGPRLDKSYVPNPNGGVEMVQYRFVPSTTVDPPSDAVPETLTL